MKVIAFFNNNGGVGKTVLVCHLAWMYAQFGYTVIAAGLDPQAELTAMFPDASRLEELWPDGGHPQRNCNGDFERLAERIADAAGAPVHLF